MTAFSPLLAPLLALALTASAQAPDPFAQIAAYDFGSDRAALNAVDRQILDAGTTTATLLSIEEKLLPVLATPGLKPAARSYVCEALGRIGSAHCVPALAPLLSTAEGADAARVALERLPVPEAGEALRAALATAPDRAKAGIANSLGARRDPARSRSSRRCWPTPTERCRPPPRSPSAASARPRPSPRSPPPDSRSNPRTPTPSCAASSRPKTSAPPPPARRAVRFWIPTPRRPSARPRSPDMLVPLPAPPPNACSPAWPIPIPP